MKKKVKIFISTDLAPKGWVNVRNFADFSSLLETLNWNDIDMISFSNDLDDDDEDKVAGFSGTDCAIKLIQAAGNRKLPQCFINDNTEEIGIILDKYTSSYNYNNFCIFHTLEHTA
jgi:hypothetical protein